MADVHLFGSFPGNATEHLAEPDRRSAATWDLNVAYEFAVKDRITLNEGQRSLDILTTPLSLAPAALARHRLNLQAAIARDTYGINISGSWQNSFRGAGIGDTGLPVTFSSLMVVNAEGFIELGRAKDEAKASKLRIKLSVDNVFNNRVRHKALGQAIIQSLAGSLFDPLGRVVRLSARKVF